MVCRPKPSVDWPFGPVAARAEDSSLTADIPSHDWGASAQWTRGGMMGLESFSVGGDFRHYQGDFNEVDFSTTCPGATCGALTRRVSSAGAQSLSGAFVQAILVLVSPLRIELSARVDRWDNTDGHSISSTPTTTATTSRLWRQQQDGVLTSRGIEKKKKKNDPMPTRGENAVLLLSPYELSSPWSSASC